MSYLYPRRTCTWEDIANEEFGIGSIELAASNMNHHRKTFVAGGANHVDDLTALSDATYVYRRREKVQL